MPSPEKQPNPQLKDQTISIIEQNLDRQPESVQKMWPDMKDKFFCAVEIDGKTFLFTKRTEQIIGQYRATVIGGLVSDEQDGSIFKPRFWRYSGSDHQWKAFPGLRADGRFLKGNEKDKMHHYVQSGKLHWQFNQEIEKIPNDESHEKITIFNYLPKIGELSEKDIEFSEEQTEIKSSIFKEYIQGIPITLLRQFEFLNGIPLSRDEESFLRQVRILIENTNNGGNIILISDLKPLDKAIEYFKNKTKVEKLDPKDDHSLLIDYLLTSVYRQSVSRYFEDYVAQYEHHPFFKKTEEPLPIARLVRAFYRGEKGNEASVYQFDSKTPDGDYFIYEMSRDSKGTLSFENFFDPSVGIDSYGTPKKKINMGLLICKNTEYDIQTVIIPDRYKKEGDSGNAYSYVGIDLYWKHLFGIYRKFELFLEQYPTVESANEAKKIFEEEKNKGQS